MMLRFAPLLLALLVMAGCGPEREMSPRDKRCWTNCGRSSPTMTDLVGTWEGPHGAKLIIGEGNTFRIPVGGQCGFPERDGVAADGYVHGHFDIKQKEGLSTPRDSKVDWYLLIYADDPGLSMWSAYYPSYGPQRIELGQQCVLTKVE